MKRSLDITERVEALLEFGARTLRLLAALADRLAAALVEHDGDDVLQRLAVLAHKRGIEQCEQNERKAERA